ncbi:sodium:solute symporter family protein [Engelhardtia mirabilis]|uniref:Cation/acetate symporter ActP n=1 Tax=Engelhardtia mirabilis TaxID=2528011 RepID=A0A518BQD9_9BACT|nr:Cation/acetate symporter ActP [Planctomycetes bacterium Pla133]QDV03508.1 Cation/acetate symporter ActP [Planctomycetes bacterium Pla86]
MDVKSWTFLIVGLTFALYIAIAIWARAGSTREFYVAGGGVHPVANGMATAADWMSAASFISMAGLISFMGYDGSVYLMGWTGGYVLLALLLAPYLRKFGRFTVPDFVGDRYYSRTARLVAVVCAIFVSFTYVAGQMRGVGVVFGRFLEVPVETGVVIGMGVVLFYAVLGGMKGITYTQVAQYCVLIFAFMVPAIFISILMTGVAVPQLGFGSNLAGEVGSRIAGGETISLLAKLDGLHAELGFAPYTSGSKGLVDVFCITLALMVGTAGLPHVIIRFYTVPRVRDARTSAGWALLFIAVLYTAAPAVGAFARTNLIDVVEGARYAESSETDAAKTIPAWFKNWENSGLIAWVDKDGDGRVRYRSGAPFDGKPAFESGPTDEAGRGVSGERLVTNAPSAGENELYIDRDIMVLANPEIAGLPNWVIALVAAGGLAAALSTAAGLLLVISTAVSHDLLKRTFFPQIRESRELAAARISAGVAVIFAGLLGIYPPGFVAQVVAFAFGLAASSFFPAILLGIFSRRMNREGAISGMVAGITFTAGYIVWFKFVAPETNTAEHWWFGISPEGIGALGMALNFAVAIAVAKFTPPPPPEIQALVSSVRVPKGAGGAQAH